MAHYRYDIIEGQGPGKWEFLKGIADRTPVRITLSENGKKIPVFILIDVLEAIPPDLQPRNSWQLKGLASLQSTKDGWWPRFNGCYDTKKRGGWIELDVSLFSFL